MVCFLQPHLTCRVWAEKMSATIPGSPMTPYMSASHFHPHSPMTKVQRSKEQPTRHLEHRRTPGVTPIPQIKARIKPECLCSSSPVRFHPFPSLLITAQRQPTLPISEPMTGTPRDTADNQTHRRTAPPRARGRSIASGPWGHVAPWTSGVVVSNHSRLV